MKINSKGFAVSTMMYMILVVGIVLIVLTLSVLSNRKLILDKIRKETTDNIYNVYGATYRDTLYALEDEAILFAEESGVSNGIVKISDLNSSVDVSMLEGYNLTDKYLNYSFNGTTYDVYLAKSNKITDLSTADTINTVGIVDYKIYGNSFQDGTPSFDDPKAIIDVGELVSDSNDENYGKYKVVIKLAKGNTNTSFNIYLDEPLRCIEDSCDYIDSESSKVVRAIKSVELKNTDTWKDINYSQTNGYFARTLGEQGSGVPNKIMFTHLTQDIVTMSTSGIAANVFDSSSYNDFRFGIRPDKTVITNLSTFKTYIQNSPIPLTLHYILTTPTEEEVEFPIFVADDTYNIITINNTVAPTQYELTIIQRIVKI